MLEESHHLNFVTIESVRQVPRYETLECAFASIGDLSVPLLPTWADPRKTIKRKITLETISTRTYPGRCCIMEWC